MTFLESVSAGVTTVEDVFSLFLTAPAIYFLGLAFVGACIGVARKLIPMRRR